jgi:hypothetical protein
MGLFQGSGSEKPAAKAFRLAQQRLLPAGRAVRTPTGDRRTFIFRYGADRYVMWGAPRPVRFEGRPIVRDAQGREIQPTAIGPDPIIVEGAAGYTLGEGPVLADSLFEYGAAPWSYFSQKPSGRIAALKLLDDRFTSWFADQYARPLRVSDAGAATAPDAVGVIRYTAAEPARAVVSACFSKPAKSAPVEIEIVRRGRSVYAATLNDRLLVNLPVDLERGETIDFRFRPAKGAGPSSFGQRIRLLRPGSGEQPLCA